MRLALISLLMIPLAVGCGKPDCGEGTHDEDGTCVADDESDTGEPIDPVVDNDEDGIAAADDCDDDDASLGNMADDGDCDGVLTAEDCDDDDAMSTTVATDADCDGVVTAEDCDDDDAWWMPLLKR